MDKANKLYANYSYVDAIATYLKVKDLDSNTTALLNLSNSYYFLSDYSQALVYYKKYYSLVPLNHTQAKNKAFFNYLQCLRSNNEINAAASLYEKVTGQKYPSLENIKVDPGTYKVEKSLINKDFDTYGVCFFNDNEVLFSSNRTINAKNTTNKIHSWNNKPYLKLFSASLSKDGEIIDESMIKGDLLDFEFHQSNPVVSKNGKKVFFTRSIYEDVSYKQSFLKIFSADLNNGVLTNIIELAPPVNTIGTSSAYPAIGPDNKLYFSSNRNSKNGSDIYYIQLNKNYVVHPKEKVLPLSDKINTPSREDFVSVTPSGVIFFSSDGHPGEGGLDVFAARFNESDNEYTVVNLGKSVNSTADDFGYVFNENLKKGFLSSNRESAATDLLYKVSEISPLKWNFSTNPIVSGVIRDSISNNPIPFAKIDVKSIGQKPVVLSSVTADENGKYSFEFPPYTDVSIDVSSERYASNQIKIAQMAPTAKLEKDIFLFSEYTILVDNKVVEMKSGQDLTEILNLQPIYFDYKGFQLTKSSKSELDKIIQLLNERQSISIEVKSHTDSRGKDDFNMKLSLNRAKTTINYIIDNSNGKISKERVFGKGYGETQLKVSCPAKECTEEQHALNRRSEFLLIFK